MVTTKYKDNNHVDLIFHDVIGITFKKIQFT